MIRGCEVNIVFTCPTVESTTPLKCGRRHSPPKSRLLLPDRDEAWKQLALWNGQWTLRHSGQWGVELTATGELIGRAGTHRPERSEWPGLEVGWTFHPDHWGRGYATEAGAAAVAWAFEHHDVDELVSVILSDNTASQAVATRLGFRWREDRLLPHFTQIPTPRNLGATTDLAQPAFGVIEQRNDVGAQLMGGGPGPDLGNRDLLHPATSPSAGCNAAVVMA